MALCALAAHKLFASSTGTSSLLGASRVAHHVRAQCLFAGQIFRIRADTARHDGNIWQCWVQMDEKCSTRGPVGGGVGCNLK